MKEVTVKEKMEGINILFEHATKIIQYMLEKNDNEIVCERPFHLAQFALMSAIEVQMKQIFESELKNK